jgi:hypothetical protein
MNNAPLTFLATFLLCSCGGRVDDPSASPIPDSPQTAEDLAADAGGSPADTEPARGDPENPGVGGSGTGGMPGTESEPIPESCPTTWWGGTLDGITGATTCRDPWDPAMLTYGQTQLPEGTHMGGPLAWKREKGFLKCQYRIQYPGDPQATAWWMTVPYFGEGAAATSIPDKPVTQAAQDCALPKGPYTPASSVLQLADHAAGAWLRCGGDAVSWGWAGEGILFSADGTWHTLRQDADGRFSLTSGCLQGGLWGFIDNDAIPSHMGQINLHTEIGTQYTIVTFYEGGRRMNIEGMADFVKVQ